MTMKYTADATSLNRTLSELLKFPEKDGKRRVRVWLNSTPYPGAGGWAVGTVFNLPQTLRTQTVTATDGTPRTEYGLQIRFSPDNSGGVHLVCLSAIERVEEAPPEDNG